MDNGWISYVGRSYRLIKSELHTRLTSSLPELTDRSPSNLFMIIIDTFSSLMEVLNYYIDSTARELYVQTARRLSSLLKIANLMNYNGKAKIPASAELVFSIKLGDEPYYVLEDLVIPAFTEVSDLNGNRWRTLTDCFIRSGFSYTVTGAQQFEFISDFLIGVSNGSVAQQFNLPSEVANDSLTVTIQSIRWSKVDSFNFSGPQDTHFQVKLTSIGIVSLVFGDGSNGKLPVNGSNIYISYRKTQGSSGNVPQNYITNILTEQTLPTDTSLDCTNPNPAYGGYDFEDMEKLRKAIPASLYTLNRAVTRRDFEVLLASAPGVRTAKLDHTAPISPIKAYIVPNSGGIATSALLNTVALYFENLALIGPSMSFRPSGESLIRVNLTLNGEYGTVDFTILAEVKQALTDFYHPQKTEINDPVLLSDLISIPHNLPSVRSVILNWFYIKPYLRPTVDDIILDYDIEILNTSTQEVSWVLYLIPSSPQQFQLLMNGASVLLMDETNFGVWQLNVGGLINFKINSLTVSSGENIRWIFKTYPYSKDCILSDFSIPVIDINNSVFTPIENYGR
jgi:hypothetical protein